MADDPVIKVDVDGEPLRLVFPGMGWTIGEARLAKEASNGMPVAEIERTMLQADPDAWTAIIRVSLLRAQRVLTQAQLEAVPVLALANAIMDAVRETTKADDVDPPVETPPSSGVETLAAAVAASPPTIPGATGSPV